MVLNRTRWRNAVGLPLLSFFALLDILVVLGSYGRQNPTVLLGRVRTIAKPRKLAYYLDALSELGLVSRREGDYRGGAVALRFEFGITQKGRALVDVISE